MLLSPVANAKAFCACRLTRAVAILLQPFVCQAYRPKTFCKVDRSCCYCIRMELAAYSSIVVLHLIPLGRKRGSAHSHRRNEEDCTCVRYRVLIQVLGSPSTDVFFQGLTASPKPAVPRRIIDFSNLCIKSDREYAKLHVLFIFVKATVDHS